MKLTKPIKVHGGKEYLADWIIKLMPPRCKNPNKPDPKDKGWLHYVEPYFGGGSVLLANDPEGISEVVNDLNGDLVAFWRTIQNLDESREFLRRCQAPFNQLDWQAAQAMKDFPPADEWLRAWGFFVRSRQSLAGRENSFSPITRERTRRGMNEQVSAWLNAVEGLPEVHARLIRVLILNQDAIECINGQDGPRTLFYLDPPYMKSTRAAPDAYGEFEMSDRAHAILLARLCKPVGRYNRTRPLSFGAFENLQGRESWHDFSRAWQKPLQGRFLLSGYRSELYDRFARNRGWTRHEKAIDNKAAGGAKKRIMTECVWTNY